MRFDPKRLITPALIGGAAGTGIYLAAGGRVLYGPPRPTNPAILRGEGGSDNPRRTRVSGGALAWNQRTEAEAEAEFEATGHYWVTAPSGRRYTLDSTDGALAVYSLVDEQRREMNRWGTLFSRALSDGQRDVFWASRVRGTAVSLEGLSPTQRDILTGLVNSCVQFANGLRVLARVYQGNRLPLSARPQSIATARVDLARILFDGFWNPMAEITGSGPGPSGVSLTRSSQWEGVGFRFLVALQGMYPTLLDLDSSESEALADDVTAFAEGSEGATMGVVWLAPFLIKLTIVIVAGGVAIVLIDKTLAAVLNWIGINTAYQKALREQYEAAMAECREGDQAACERAETIADRIEAYDSRMMSTIVTVAIGLGVAAVSFFVISRLGRKRRLGGRSRRALPA